MFQIMLPGLVEGGGSHATVSVLAVLTLGFFLGMRHATDADHVVAVSAIVMRERNLRAAAPIGVLWGIGHTVTVLLVGGAITLFGVVIPPRFGLALELCAALMLVTLGGLNICNVLFNAAESSSRSSSGAHVHSQRPIGSVRPLAVGVVHGLAGSAAIALLVLGAINSAVWAACYLLVFSVGTVAGMMLITLGMALPLSLAARGFERLHKYLRLGSGFAGVIFGVFLVYQIGFVHGLFTAHAHWAPQ